MANRHIKTINGRKYYYSSIRVGKKVTSKYLGPVERIRTKKRNFNPEEMQEQEEVQNGPVQEQPGDVEYIG